MSDLGGVDFQQLYNQVLQQYPRSKGKTASPQKDMQAAVSWKKMIDTQLGFDPMTYESPTKQPYSPKSSAVLEQYKGNAPVSSALADIQSGQENSDSLAQLLIDPATGEVTPDGTKLGYTTANATTAVKAAQEYEKESAQNKTAQADYEARQAADPTYGRTKGSTNGKQVLPEGNLNGLEKPSFGYDQGLLDLVQSLSSTPEVSMPPPPPPISGHPAQQVGQIATTTNPYGGMQVDTSIHNAIQNPKLLTSAPHDQGSGPPGMTLPAGAGRTMTPVMSPATGYFAQQHNPLAQIAQFARQITPQVGPSAQDRAANALQGYQKFAQNYVQPVHTAANNAAVQKLMQVIALQG